MIEFLAAAAFFLGEVGKAFCGLLILSAISLKLIERTRFRQKMHDKAEELQHPKEHTLLDRVKWVVGKLILVAAYPMDFIVNVAQFIVSAKP